MSQRPSNNKALAVKIASVVESCLPSTFERGLAHLNLQNKIEAVLDEGWLASYETESCQVTILLADIRGFTALAEIYSAKVVMDMLNRYFSVMSEVIMRFGGTIDKLMGDAVMVLFGAPKVHKDDVERAIACAISMQQAMATFNQQNKVLGLPDLFIGIGINTGEVVAGPLGSLAYREYTVIGDEVNLASRIEAQSLRGQVLISDNTYQLCKNYVLVGQTNNVQVRGKREPVTLYELLGTTLPRAMTVPRREVRKSPRVAVKMPCYFQQVDGKTVHSQQFKGEVIDIGYYGLLIVSPVKVDVFTEIKMEVSLAFLSSETNAIYARVLQCEPLDHGFRCSLEFTAIGLAGQQSIKRFVDSMIER